MTRRVLSGALSLMLALAPLAAESVPLPIRSGGSGEEPLPIGLPRTYRASSGTTWVDVGQACADADTLGSSHSPLQVWCFEGADGDSSWPLAAGQGSGDWDHWSRYDPPNPDTKWFISSSYPGPNSGSFNAWLGCDGLGGNPGCAGEGTWVDPEGYGNRWNHALILEAGGQDASAGGTIEFDLRYDTECLYDYLYLEYRNGTGNWAAVVDTAGVPAVFNGLSGSMLPCSSSPGSVVWEEDVTFPLPVQAGGIALRWRGESDGAASDEDGRINTRGLAALDNVEVTFTATGSVVSDDFESATGPLDFSSSLTTTIGPAASWSSGLVGNPYDGWHLTFDPSYKNKGNTCDFSNDWMWASKPDGSPIPENGFSYFLVSPTIACAGWNAGVVEFSTYRVLPDPRQDATATHVRTCRAGAEWSSWQTFTGYIFPVPAPEWHMNEREDLTPHLGVDVDSLQIGYEMLDLSEPGDYSWGKHASVTWLIDNVSIGSYDGTATQVAISTLGMFRDTFSRRDPAHTVGLDNSEEGQWPGRVLDGGDSLQVSVQDVDGITDGNVDLFWRVGAGTPPAYGSWESKNMNFSVPDILSDTDEGTYRTTIGNGTSEDYGAGADIWDAGTTVEYYVHVTDDLDNVLTFPDLSEDAPFRFRVLPMGRELSESGERLLVVDDYGRDDLDFQNSRGFNPTGGMGFGSFTNPAYRSVEAMVEAALVLQFGGDDDDEASPLDGGPKWDVYEVFGEGSSLQVEPRILADEAAGIGGLASSGGVPHYDAVIWLNGTFDAYSLTDPTRIGLKTYLDNGGQLLSSGDNVARFLSGNPGGSAADSVIQFLQDYLGTEFVKDDTVEKILNVGGEAGTSLEWCVFGLYGECNGIRKNYDQLIGSETVGTETILARYRDGGAADTGVAAIKNVTGLGTTVHLGFGLESLLYDDSRRELLASILRNDFGFGGISRNDTCFDVPNDAPVVSPDFRFTLSAPQPNPFSDSTTLEYSLNARGAVSLIVYDVLGRRVRTLVDGVVEAGPQQTAWDGLTDDGSRASAGIYFYRLTAGERSATKRAVRIR